MKLIELTRSKYAMVDDEDFDRVNEFKWYAAKGKHTYYCQRTEGSSKNKNKVTLHLHKFILNTTSIVDHKDGNGLNNQKYNLRTCTYKLNIYNSAGNKNATSIYKGVYKTKTKIGSFETQIKIDYKSYSIGRNIDEIICAKYYDAVARFYHGEFAKCNFEEIFIEPMSKENAKAQMKIICDKFILK